MLPSSRNQQGFRGLGHRVLPLRDPRRARADAHPGGDAAAGRGGAQEARCHSRFRRRASSFLFPISFSHESLIEQWRVDYCEKLHVHRQLGNARVLCRHARRRGERGRGQEALAHPRLGGAAPGADQPRRGRGERAARRRQRAGQLGQSDRRRALQQGEPPPRPSSPHRSSRLPSSRSRIASQFAARMLMPHRLEQLRSHCTQIALRRH